MGEDNTKSNLKPVKKYRETPKYNLWVKYFLGLEGNEEMKKKTFGNMTQSAIMAYRLDPVEQYESAVTMGRENFAKLRFLGAMILEKKGLTFSALMDIGAKKMAEGKYTDWEMFMERLGYFEPRQGLVVTQQVSVNLANLIREQQEKYGK